MEVHVGKLVYLMNVSLDGYVNTPDGGLDWPDLDDELHQWFNDELRNASAEIYGRRLYEVMTAYWPTALDDPAAGEVERDFARVWNAVPKVVVSTTLESAEHGFRLERDPFAALERLRGEFDGEVAVGGPTLASAFIRRDLVDEYRLFVSPVVLGAGTPYFPPVDDPLELELVETRTFGSRVVYVRYRRARK
jgi:dihydrofolate reductase